ncbi:hypothetical protein ACMWGD_16820, partial [Klebsiella pneumoniae]
HQHPVIVGVNAENIGLRQLKYLQRRQISGTLNDGAQQRRYREAASRSTAVSNPASDTVE